VTPLAVRREVLVALLCTVLCFLLALLLVIVLANQSAWSWDREGLDRECRAKGSDSYSLMEGCL
jgi:hypothetical protein